MKTEMITFSEFRNLCQLLVVHLEVPPWLTRHHIDSAGRKKMKNLHKSFPLLHPECPV